MYNYETEKPKTFTEDGQKLFLNIRDNVHLLLRQAGAVNMERATSNTVSATDSWTEMACVDRLVELEEIREIDYGKCPGQYRIFVGVNNE